MFNVRMQSRKRNKNETRIAAYENYLMKYNNIKRKKIIRT